MIVVDASALLEVLLRTNSGLQIETRIFDISETLHAPHLIDLEVAQVLRRYSMSGMLESSRAREALHDFVDFPITRYPHDSFLPRIWELRYSMTAYVAVYVALAEILESPLFTCDSRLAGAIGHGATIELIQPG